MKDEEKNLIENLFHRLKKTELSSSERDDMADNLIQNFVIKQPHSSYYMVQTLLIQETALKKMSLQIEELQKRISILNEEKLKKKSSFLSNFLKKDPVSQTTTYDNNDIWKNNRNNVESYNKNFPMSSTTTTSGNSSFLKNALQTATGVAGGMILGNMLMNLFNNHSSPEEEIFDNVNQSSSISDLDKHDNISDHMNHHADLVDYNTEKESIDSSDSNFSNFNDIENIDDSEINDDNFI